MKTKTKKPGKQRKRLYNAPYHRRNDILSAHLSSEMKTSHNTRSVPVRAGDTIRVLRGNYKGFEGKVMRVNRKKYQIFVDGINQEKADGTSILVPIHPSKVEVVRLHLDDKWRKKILKRKGSPEEIKMLDETLHENTEEVETSKKTVRRNNQS